MLKVSALVPCFNEEKTAGQVISALLACPQISEIIAINDGSTDQTSQILKSFASKIKLINFKKNRGKGAALAAGIKKAKGDLILFVDADLIGLKPYHLQKMITSFLKNKADVVLADLYSKNDTSRNLFYYRFFDNLTKSFIKYDFLTGERLYFKKDLLPLLPKMKKLGYGVEVFLNHEFQGKKIKVVKLNGVFQPPKEQKNGFSSKTFKLYLREALEISKELARQQGIKGQKALDFRIKFIQEFLKNYVKPAKEWTEIFKNYLEKILS